MKITFLGAAQTVTGSCYVIETGSSRFAVDCAVCALPVEAREVRVVSGMIGGAMLGLSVENGYVGEIAFAPNGLPTSHKKDHGVGLASVAATVKRHNGTFSIAAKDGVFSAHILLSL